MRLLWVFVVCFVLAGFALAGCDSRSTQEYVDKDRITEKAEEHREDVNQVTGTTISTAPTPIPNPQAAPSPQATPRMLTVKLRVQNGRNYSEDKPADNLVTIAYTTPDGKTVREEHQQVPWERSFEAIEGSQVSLTVIPEVAGMSETQTTPLDLTIRSGDGVAARGEARNSEKTISGTVYFY